MKQSHSGSYLMFIASMLIFGTIGIFRRYIPLSSALLACTRGLLGSLVLVIFVRLTGRKLRHGIGPKYFWALVLIGAAIGFNWILLFEAYNYTSVATATLCYYMQPTIVILFSPLFFREKLTARKLLCASLSLLGMFFVSGMMDGDGLHSSDVRGILCGLGAAALYASVVIMNKKVQVEDAYEKTVIQLFSAAAVLIPYLLLTEDLHTLHFSGFSLLMLLVVGVLHTGIAYALYFASMKSLPAQSIAVLSYIDPISALILSGLILHEQLTLFGILGAALIIGAALLSELNFSKKYA